MCESCAAIFDLIPMEVLDIVLGLSRALPCRLMLISHTNRALRLASLKALGRLKYCELHPTECLCARKKSDVAPSSAWMPLRCQAFAEVRGRVHKTRLKPSACSTVLSTSFNSACLTCESPVAPSRFAQFASMQR